MTVCPKCDDTGLADSGGTQPWGDPILIPCDCDAPRIEPEPPCYDCIGMAQHGCWCDAQGGPRGGPGNG